MGVVGPDDWADGVVTIAPAFRREVVARMAPGRLHGASLADVDELVVSRHVFAAVTAELPYAARARIATIVGHDSDPRLVFAPALSWRARAIKRLADVVVGSLALAVTAPVLAGAMLAIRLESRGPVLFRQERPGLDGRAFTLLKLRTMRVGNDDHAHRDYVASLIRGTGTSHDGIYKLTGDPRVTRVGRFLRRYSLDELPQLINVLRGEMSLVGPRPPVPAEVDHYDVTHWLRLRVKPGLTGAWQVAGRCELTYAEMVALDVDYWQRWTWRAEVRILLRTVPAVLSGKGAA